MENSVKVLQQYYSNANNGLFSTVTIITIEANSYYSVTVVLVQRIYSGNSEASETVRSEPWKIFLSERLKRL